MTRLFVSLTALLALSSFAQGAAAEAPATKQKLTVMPFAALTGDVPARAGAKAVGMLTTEFKSADAFALVDAKREKAGGAAEAALETARKEVGDAKELRGKKKFRLAEEALNRGIAAYKTAIPALPEIGEVVDAYVLLSAVQFNTGRDEEGAKSLNQALAMAPDREVGLASSSPLFARVVADARKALKDGAKGTVLLESSPSNAPVLIDGLALGATPLAITAVPPGLHFWKATLPSGEAIGGVIEVTANKQATAKAASASKDPEARVLTALSQNKLDADLVAAAKETAKANEADLIVFGALSKDGKGLALDTFLFTAATGDVRRMARASFDTELLSAGMEFYNLAGELAKKGSQVGEPVRVPSSVSSTLVSTAAKTSEARYGIVPGAEIGVDGDAIEPAKDEGPRKPIEQKRRAPLRRQ
ncbi:MAG: hypothetical protein DI536_00235 [Archangium gephyra]|uniref:PEGA domain-containing protein n=1 Tax=Archangium gephyra TaxID=48 RepID=A0A2W5TRM5_9BACT|nr:MAG: hypothetical protein DI536_00235 [Archangium gephyra]